MTPKIRPSPNTSWTKESGSTMDRNKHAEAQITGALKQIEAGCVVEADAQEQAPADRNSPTPFRKRLTNS